MAGVCALVPTYWLEADLTYCARPLMRRSSVRLSSRTNLASGEFQVLESDFSPCASTLGGDLRLFLIFESGIDCSLKEDSRRSWRQARAPDSRLPVLESATRPNSTSD